MSGLELGLERDVLMADLRRPSNGQLSEQLVTPRERSRIASICDGLGK